MEAGQGLIGTARSERTASFKTPAAGTVVAQLEWQTDQSVPLAETMSQLTGENKTNYRLLFAGTPALSLHPIGMGCAAPGICN